MVLSVVRIGHYRELASLGQLVLVAPEGEGLRHVCPRPGELHPQLVHGLGVLRRGLGGPHARRGVAAPLQREDVAAVPEDDLARGQPRQQVLRIVRSARQPSSPARTTHLALAHDDC